MSDLIAPLGQFFTGTSAFTDAQLMLQDLALTLRSTGAAEEIEIIEAERDKLAAVRVW